MEVPQNNGMGLSRVTWVVAVLATAVLLGALAVFIISDETPVAYDPQPSGEPAYEVIGRSVEGRAIESYTYGVGDTKLLLVGGIHGGYEWNSVLLAYVLMDYLDTRPEAIPPNVAVTVIPSLNPDGVFRVLGKEGRFAISNAPKSRETAVPGRFNVNGVDLNRNFDCKWASESTWRGNVVSAGTEAFSEPEAVALRDFVLRHRPAAAIFFHSKAGAVYASECHEGVLPETLDILAAYSFAAGYRSVESFDAYPVTGDAEGWLASLGIPALTVELHTHDELEWEENLRGVRALLSYYADRGNDP